MEAKVKFPEKEVKDLSKKDCYAYPSEGHTECYCLSKCYCKNEKCNFYKPKDQVSIGEIENDIRKYALTEAK